MKGIEGNPKQTDQTQLWGSVGTHKNTSAVAIITVEHRVCFILRMSYRSNAKAKAVRIQWSPLRLVLYLVPHTNLWKCFAKTKYGTGVSTSQHNMAHNKRKSTQEGFYVCMTVQRERGYWILWLIKCLHWDILTQIAQRHSNHFVSVWLPWPPLPLKHPIPLTLDLK